jgi:hypothetical protein
MVLSLTTSLALPPLAGFAQETQNSQLQNYQNPAIPTTEGFQKNERSSQGSDFLGDGFNPLNLIHNANLRRSRNGADFAEDSQTNLNKAAADFKRQQQLRLQQQQAAPVAGGASSKP